VAIGKQFVSVWFSQNITGFGGDNVRLVKASDNSEVPFTRSFDPATNRLYINPFGGVEGAPERLDPATEYTVVLTGGPSAIRSTGGVPLGSQEFSFTTAAAGNAPTVTSTDPADGATGVAIGKQFVSVYFSQNITGFGGTNVRLVKASDNSEVPFTRSFDPATNRLYINPFGGAEGAPERLDPDTQYRVILTGGTTGIRSLSGVPLASQEFDFTTAASATAPTVVATTPAAGATGVNRGIQHILVTFSQAVTGYTGSNVTITRVSDNADVPFTRSFEASTNRLFMNPFGGAPGAAERLEPGTQYRVTLTGGPNALRSVGGVPLATQSFVFTTAP
jgi:hypothetical protein